MKLLFAARLARPDLVVAITRLASKVTSWNKGHDRALRRLMQYTRSPSQDSRLFGPRPWKILATTYEQMGPWACQTLVKIL